MNEYIISKNHGAKKLKSVDCKEIGNNFYVWRNNSKTDYEVLFDISLEDNRNLIETIKEKIKNGSYGTAEDIYRTFDRINKRRGINNRGSIAVTDRQSDIGNVGISSGKLSGQGADTYERADTGESDRDTSEDTISYFVDSIEEDVKELTQERKKCDHLGTYIFWYHLKKTDHFVYVPKWI